MPLCSGRSLCGAMENGRGAKLNTEVRKQGSDGAAHRRPVCACKKEGLEQAASRGNAVSSSGACGYFVTFQSFTQGRSQGQDTCQKCFDRVFLVAN